MKKYIILLLFCIGLFMRTQTIYSQEKEDVPSIEAKNANFETLDNSQKSVQYDLPYPGILPDHPLYILKTIRDKLILFLITSQDKKILYYLLQADKGIASSSILVEKHMYDLANKTLLKAENNMTEITFVLFGLPEKPSKDLLDKLKTASHKHQEIIKMNLERLPEDKRSTFNTVLEFSERNLSRIIEYEQEALQ